MILLADGPAVVTFASFDAISALIAAFFFYCLAQPHRVKNRTQFWAAFGVILLIIVFYTLRLMFYNSSEGQVFTGVMIGLLQIGGVILTVLYVGGLTIHEVAGEIGEAVDEFRGARTKKTVIVPLSGDEPKLKYDDPIAAPRYNVELPKKSDGGLPLE